METINTKNSPAAIGPYSQAKVAGQLIFTSGQLPIDAETGEMPADITGQTHQSCKNIRAILEEGNSNLENVVKATCFLADMSYFDEFNEVYSKYFTSKPARSCFAVKELPKGALCEIEVIAIID